MTRAEGVIEDYRKIIDQVNKQSTGISDKALQMIAQSLFSISVSLAQMLDAMEGEHDGTD